MARLLLRASAVLLAVVGFATPIHCFAEAAKAAGNNFEEVVYDLEGFLLPDGIYGSSDRDRFTRSMSVTEQVIDLITQTVHPGSWATGGATCLKIEDRAAVVVRNSKEVQADVRDLMDQLYRLQAVQIYFSADLVEVTADDWKRLPAWKDARDESKFSSLRRTTVEEDNEPVELKSQSTRRLLAYNGQPLKVSTKAKGKNAPLVEHLLLQPVVTADLKRLRLAVTAENQVDHETGRLQSIELADGESLLVPLPQSMWDAKQEMPQAVLCYRLTARILVSKRDGAPLVKWKSR